jgi:hypothetical protein
MFMPKNISVVDRHLADADPDHTFHFDADLSACDRPDGLTEEPVTGRAAPRCGYSMWYTR